ncbi:hypothetical protein [Nonomuraea zeae]|uniref:Uncharacterized protein n=1 Tax=Nonomuraea zeae TaxID=1642303 RepID=A0A5S4G9D8_9ACTN|nr:hypothetical protein [Nonomuraea zeae]TMR29482.1 hypothetical protein ETD85_32325 [Nonomuraea zeae]
MKPSLANETASFSQLSLAVDDLRFRRCAESRTTAEARTPAGVRTTVAAQKTISTLTANAGTFITLTNSAAIFEDGG